jgi:glutamate dehydrogenase
MPVQTQYQLFDKMEKTLNFSTGWMLKNLTADVIDTAHILDYKERLFTLLESIDHDRPAQELIPGNAPFNHFFDIIDYLRFAVAAILIKEHKDNSFDNIATLFYLIIRHFQIMQLITSLDELKIIEKSDHTLKRQMLLYIEFIVVHFTEKILSFQRTEEAPVKAFENYLASNKERFENISIQIDKLLESESKDVKELVITVNLLMGIAV